MKNINGIPNINQRLKEAKEELINFLKSLNNVQVCEKKKSKNIKKAKTSSTKAKKSQKKEEENVYHLEEKKLEEEVFSLDY